MMENNGVSHERCRREAAELTSLLQSLELINSTLDYHGVLDHLMDLAMKITDSEASSALLVEDGRLCFTAASGLRSAEVKKVYLERDEGVAGWVCTKGVPLRIHDVTADERFSGRVDKSSGFVTRSILAVPLKIDDEVIGVIEAVNKCGGREFSSDDERLLSMLAGPAAMAINKARLYRDLNDLFLSTIQAITNAIEAKDHYTRGHSERIRTYSLLIADELGLSSGERKDVEIAALLHDVGKIGISELILRKQDRLTAEEAAEIRKHPDIGADILSSIKQMKGAILGIRYHQERFDGRGYPEGLSGDRIPFIARIISVADTFDAMTSDRSYRKALSESEAVDELRRCAGTQFDPDCVAAFFRAHEKGLVKSQKTLAAEDAARGFRDDGAGRARPYLQ